MKTFIKSYFPLLQKSAKHEMKIFSSKDFFENKKESLLILKCCIKSYELKLQAYFKYTINAKNDFVTPKEILKVLNIHQFINLKSYYECSIYNKSSKANKYHFHVNHVKFSFKPQHDYL